MLYFIIVYFLVLLEVNTFFPVSYLWSWLDYVYTLIDYFYTFTENIFTGIVIIFYKDFTYFIIFPSPLFVFYIYCCFTF